MPADPTYHEQELLLRLAEGDVQAFQHFYDAYYNSLVFFSWNLIKDQHQSEDIALESFVKLWEKRAGIESIEKLRGYLFTVARNACLDYLKHRTVKERAQQVLSLEGMVSEGRIEANLVAADLIRLVYAEISQLPGAYREVLELLYLEDLSSAEAAGRLGISLDNLRQRKARAIKELRVELLKKGISGLLVTLFFI